MSGYRDELDIADRATIEKAIRGALKSQIDAHGPITRESYGSAASRVYGTLRRRAHQQQGADKDTRFSTPSA